jgi:hypothetical protein
MLVRSIAPAAVVTSARRRKFTLVMRTPTIVPPRKTISQTAVKGQCGANSV